MLYGVVRMFNDCLFNLYFLAIPCTSIEEEIKMIKCWSKLSWWKNCAHKCTDLILHKYVRMCIYRAYISCKGAINVSQLLYIGMIM